MALGRLYRISGRAMKFRIAYWLLLVALVLGGSCSRSPGIEVTDTTVSDETEVSDCIARYFREQLDTLLPSSPPEWLFTVGVSKDSVADAKKSCGTIGKDK